MTTTCKGLIPNRLLDHATLIGNAPEASAAELRIAERIAEGLPGFDPVRATFVYERGNKPGRARTDQGRIILLQETSPISNQGRIGSCTANRRCDGLELRMRPGRVVQLSRLDCYWNSRWQTGDHNRDAGSYSHISALVAEHIGIARESLWPYDDTPPPLDQDGAADGSLDAPMLKRATLMAALDGQRHVVPEGSIQKIRGSGKGRIAQIKAAIDLGFPVGIDAAVGQDFCDDRLGRAERAYTSPEHSVGGHALLIVGYWERSDGTCWFRIRNSWGTGFGDAGYCWFTDVYVGSALDVEDVDVTTRPPVGYEEAA